MSKKTQKQNGELIPDGNLLYQKRRETKLTPNTSINHYNLGPSKKQKHLENLEVEITDSCI